MLFAYGYGTGAATWILICFYCSVVFYVAAVIIGKDNDVDFDQVRFGAGIISGVVTLLYFLAICFAPILLFLWLAILAVVVFFVYALEAGLIVKHAVVATVLFLVMFLPGLFGILYLMGRITVG